MAAVEAPPPARRVRLTANARHAQLVRAAVEAFAASGYAATTTEDVARLAGVSQPYVIRVFGTKQALFLAAVEHACDRIDETFRAAATIRPDFKSLGMAYQGLLREPELLVLLHAFAASADPAIGPVVRLRYGNTYRLVRELTGADVAQAREFLSTGMLLTVLAAMDVVAPDRSGREPWADELLRSVHEIPPGAPYSHP